MVLPKLKQEEKFSYADYLTWDDQERWELIAGAPFYMSPAPLMKHQRLSGTLFSSFFSYLTDKKCEVYAAPFHVRLAE